MKKIIILFGIALLLLFSSGCSSLKERLKLSFNDELCPVSSISIDEKFALNLSDKVPIHLYFLDEERKCLKMEVRHISIGEAKKSVESLGGAIVRELILGPKGDNKLKQLIPVGTKIVAEPTFKEGVMTIDLSKEFIDGVSKDEIIEKMALFSIVNSLTEIKEVDRVSFLIEGKQVKSTKGKLKFDAEFPRNPSMISSHHDEETSEVMEVLD